ncbi:EamA family transporter, partial [Pantoea ananatis]
MPASGHQTGGATAVIIAAVLWGTTGTAATFAPALSPLAV